MFAPIATIVGLAMAAAVSLGAGLLLLSQAGVSAAVVATLQSATRGFPPTRLLDATAVDLLRALGSRS